MTDNLDALMERIPPEVMDSFTPDQRAALAQATSPIRWRHHPINLRVAVPMPFAGRRGFLTIVGGAEKRSPDRVARERDVYPVMTKGNMVFMGLGWGLMGMPAVLAAVVIWRFFQVGLL
jgi:hypothetical protein